MITPDVASLYVLQADGADQLFDNVALLGYPSRRSDSKLFREPTWCWAFQLR